MEHATTLVVDVATPHACWQGGCPCSCAKLAAAGWKVRCSACGRGVTAEERAALLEPYAEFAGILKAVQEIYGGDDVDAEDESSIEPYDVERDARLVDEGERRVA